MYRKINAFVLLTVLLLPLFWMPVWGQVVIEETGSSIFPSRFMRSEGKVHALVIPVEFADFRFSEDPVSQLDAIFNGEGSSQAPSVSEYFDLSSYGAMQFSAGIQPVVSLSASRNSYSSDHPALIQELLTVVESRGVDLQQFDQNQDGVLDGLYLVWAGATQNAGASWWPYSDTFYWEFIVSGIQIGSYTSLSYELLLQNSSLRQYTAIHETGHQLGLTDYYASSYQSGTGASVMMDRNEGDEDCFSKMLLGWVTPKVIEESCYVTLSSISTQGDAALIAVPGWDGNYLSEYFMAEYVTPQANHSRQEIPDSGGVRIWHVNAATSRWTDDITPSMYRYQNSGNGPKLLTIIDPAQQWYLEGDRLSADQMLLSSGERSEIEIRIQSLAEGQAILEIIYNGLPPAKPEESTDSSSDVANSDTEESSVQIPDADEEVSQSDASEKAKEEEPSEPADEVKTEESESTAEETAKAVPAVVPILIILGIGVLLCYLLLADSKKKNKKRRKRKK